MYTSADHENGPFCKGHQSSASPSTWQSYFVSMHAGKPLPLLFFSYQKNLPLPIGSSFLLLLLLFAFFSPSHLCFIMLVFLFVYSSERTIGLPPTLFSHRIIILPNWRIHFLNQNVDLPAFFIYFYFCIICTCLLSRDASASASNHKHAVPTFT